VAEGWALGAAVGASGYAFHSFSGVGDRLLSCAIPAWAGSHANHANTATATGTATGTCRVPSGGSAGARDPVLRCEW
jgi:hypothetical protein